MMVDQDGFCIHLLLSRSLVIVSVLQRARIQCSAVKCSEVQYSAVQCSAVKYKTVQCSAVQCSAVQCRYLQERLHARLYRSGWQLPLFEILILSIWWREEVRLDIHRDSTIVSVNFIPNIANPKHSFHIFQWGNIQGLN